LMRPAICRGLYREEQTGAGTGAAAWWLTGGRIVTLWCCRMGVMRVMYAAKVKAALSGTMWPPDGRQLGRLASRRWLFWVIQARQWPMGGSMRLAIP
jgi:hypothetical protein